MADLATIPDVRLRRLATRVHALGPRPLYELFSALLRGADLLREIDAYAALDADFIRALGADEFHHPFIAAGLDQEDDVA